MPMMATRWGRIVNISSISGVLGARGQANYAAAKAGLKCALLHCAWTRDAGPNYRKVGNILLSHLMGADLYVDETERPIEDQGPLAAFMARLMVLVSRDHCHSYSHPFVDVSPTSFAKDDFGCIYEFGITTGTSATTYGPYDLVTREQMGAFLGRLYRLLASGVSLGD